MTELVFIVSPPRSGSTLLLRMLAGHPDILGRPEPHLMPPLAHLGYWEAVERAPYDQLQAAQAMKELVTDLPGGEAAYFNACRAYADALYGPLAQAQGKRYFLDKTPANALVLPFIEKVYPEARYIVLLRHPAAILASYANSFFDGDYESARLFNPILSRYVPAMARFLQHSPCPTLPVHYETLAQDPDSVLAEVCSFLDIPVVDDLSSYGDGKEPTGGLGDPLGVAQHSRPVTSSIHRWVGDMQDPEAAQEIQRALALLDDGDLEVWGYPRSTLMDPLHAAEDHSPRKARVRGNRFLLQRRVLNRLRRWVRRSEKLRGLLRKLRWAADVLLRA